MRTAGRLPAAIAALLVAGALGCATIGFGDDDVVRRTVVYEGATYDATWSAVIRTFAELELPISTLEKESGLVATDWILVDDPEDAMDCDHGYRNAEMRFNVLVRSVAAGQEMTITTAARARGEDPGSLERCRSTGFMESRIQRRVRGKLG